MKYLGRISDPKDLVTKEYVDGEVESRQSQVTYRTVTLTVAGWAEDQQTGQILQTVTVPGVVADELAQWLTPMPATEPRSNKKAYDAAGIQAIAQGADSMTFCAETIPEVDLTVYITITALAAGEGAGT